MKKAVSLITAAVMTMAAAGSFASFAEDEYSYKSSPIYDEIYEITLKNTDEYMAKLKVRMQDLTMNSMTNILIFF